MDSECCHPPINITKNLDCKMVKLYHSVLRCEIEEGRIYAGIVKNVKMAYCKETISSGNSDIDFSSPSTRCAYVYLYCACFASTTAYHFLQLLNDDTELLRAIFYQDTFTLCCLGGGPGTEIAAIAKISEELIRSCYPTRRKPLVIKATIIDIDPGWAVTAENVVRSLPQLIDTSLVRCELDFIEADLTQPLSQCAIEAIRRANFVTMVKFLSGVHGSEHRNRSEEMLKEIITCIKEGGRLFFLDSAASMHYDVFRKAVESFPDMVESYGPRAHDTYKMSVYSVVRSIELNEDFFGWQFPCTFTANYVSAWRKDGGGASNRGLHPAEVEMENESTDKKRGEREMRRHALNCFKFCVSRFGQGKNRSQECTFQDSRMFLTKSKRRRITEEFKV